MRLSESGAGKAAFISDLTGNLRLMAGNAQNRCLSWNKSNLFRKRLASMPSETGGSRG
ncbi:hypothetical protein NOC27_399 [Nitrosococcus oceani AFC27]|nr:hypothetical protein NOC27_399 [Nitrosococcus oceani AFC27]